MGTGSRDGDRGSINFDIGEPFSGNPNIAPGFPRPIGWRVREPDGTAAYDKVGPLDTDWQALGTGAAGVDPDVGNGDMILNLDMQKSGFLVNGFDKVTFIPDQSLYGNDANQTEFFGPTPLWPALSSSGINGFPAITVGNNETGGIGRNNIDAAKWLPSTQNWCALMVCKATSSQGPLPFIPGFDGIVFPRISFGAYTAVGGVQQFAIPSFTGGFTAVPYTDGLVDYTNVPIVLAFNCLANVCTVTVNGFSRPIATFTGADAIAFRSYVMGIAGGGGGETDVGEVRFYRTGQSDPNLASRVSYLGAKWRIPLVNVANVSMLAPYWSDTFDLSATPTLALNIPSVAGKLFRMIGTLHLEYLSVTGTPNVNGVYTVQKDGVGITGFIGIPINAATLAGFPPPVSVNENNSFPILDTGNHVYTIKIVTAVGGVTASQARFALSGYFA